MDRQVRADGMRAGGLPATALAAGLMLSLLTPQGAAANPFVILEAQNPLTGITGDTIRLPDSTTLSALQLRTRASSAPRTNTGLLVFDVATRHYVPAGLCQLLVLNVLANPEVFDIATRSFRRLRSTESLGAVLGSQGTFAVVEALDPGPCAGRRAPGPDPDPGPGPGPAPIPPVADADGPYLFCELARPFVVDGTGSVNPDEGVSESGAPGDTIQSFAWDLDNDGQFDDAAGAQPDVTAVFSALGPGDFPIGLQVTDTTAAAFPGSGQPDLSDTDTSTVSVKSASDPACICIPDLAVRAKTGLAQLTWTDTGAPLYHVYRGTTAGGPYAFVAATDSRYSTYLDRGLMDGTTYFYVVREATLSAAERCQSNEASATPTERRRRR